MGVMARERLKLMLNQAIGAMDMVVMEEAMEVMVDTEATVVMVMAREMLKLMLSQVTEAMEVMVMAREKLKLNQVTEAMDMVVMEEAMEVMVDTEAMEVMVMARERLQLNQVTEAMVMVVMDMEEVTEVMVDTEAMAMESNSIYFTFKYKFLYQLVQFHLSKFQIKVNIEIK